MYVSVLGTDLTRVTTTAEFALGQLAAVVTNSGTKVYKYVQYDEGSAGVDGVAGEVTYYYTLINQGHCLAINKSKLCEFRETPNVKTRAILSRALNKEGATTIPQGSTL